MSLWDILESNAGSAVLQQIGARVGLSPDQLRSAVTSLAPAIGGRLGEHAAAGNLPQTQIDDPASSDAVDHGNDILGTIFGSKDVSRSVATDASAETGIGVDKLKSLLPLLASIATTVLASRAAASSPGQTGLGGALGGLGGLLGSLTR